MKDAHALIVRYASMLSALGQEARLLIVRHLIAAYPGGLVVGELQSRLEMAPSTLSHHLDILVRQGIAARAREGTFLRYTVQAEVLEELLAFMLRDCCRASFSALLAPVACCSPLSGRPGDTAAASLPQDNTSRGESNG